MIFLLLLMLAGPKFVITVGQYGDRIGLHYPHEDEHLRWEQVCVYSTGDQEHTSCWVPRFGLEEYRLEMGTVRVKGVLTVNEDGVRRDLVTPEIPVRPEGE